MLLLASPLDELLPAAVGLEKTPPLDVRLGEGPAPPEPPALVCPMADAPVPPIAAAPPVRVPLPDEAILPPVLDDPPPVAWDIRSSVE